MQKIEILEDQVSSLKEKEQSLIQMNSMILNAVTSQEADKIHSFVRHFSIFPDHPRK